MMQSTSFTNRTKQAGTRLFSSAASFVSTVARYFVYSSSVIKNAGTTELQTILSFFNYYVRVLTVFTSRNKTYRSVVWSSVIPTIILGISMFFRPFRDRFTLFLNNSNPGVKLPYFVVFCYNCTGFYQYLPAQNYFSFESLSLKMYISVVRQILYGLWKHINNASSDFKLLTNASNGMIHDFNTSLNTLCQLFYFPGVTWLEIESFEQGDEELLTLDVSDATIDKIIETMFVYSAQLGESSSSVTMNITPSNEASKLGAYGNVIICGTIVVAVTGGASSELHFLLFAFIFKVTAYVEIPGKVPSTPVIATEACGEVVLSQSAAIELFITYCITGQFSTINSSPRPATPDSKYGATPSDDGPTPDGKGSPGTGGKGKIGSPRNMSTSARYNVAAAVLSVLSDSEILAIRNILRGKFS